MILTLTPTQEQFTGIVKLLTVVAGSATFVALGIKKNKLSDFGNVWNGALAGAGVVTGLAVVVCAIVSSLIPALDDMRLYLGITGLSLVFLSVRSIVDAWGPAPKPTASDPGSGSIPPEKKTD